MKKILVAIFLVGIMLLVPISNAYRTSNNESIQITEDDSELPRFVITDDEYSESIDFIEENFDEDEKPQAYNLLSRVVNTDENESELEIDLINLTYELLSIYIPIPEEELNNINSEQDLDDLLNIYWGVTPSGFIENLFGELLIKIVEFIKDRLGWIYRLFNDGLSLFYNGTTLVVDVIKPISFQIAVLFVFVVNKLLSAPMVIAEAINELFQQHYTEFDEILNTFANEFASDISALIDEIIGFVTHPQIVAYLNELQKFVNWLGEEPWTDKIHVIGSVKTLLLGQPWPGLIINCKGEDLITDSNGEFDFYVDPSPDGGSFPKNQYYGMHNCQISVSNENKLKKQSIELLSYCFSGGEISWSFRIIQKKTKDERLTLFELFENFLKNIQSLFPNFFRIIRDIYINPVYN